MAIRFENIVLRDMKESDIEDYVRWFTIETEWMDWDAPWEDNASDADSERRSWTSYYERARAMPDDVLRSRFEIECEGRHIGYVSSYFIDENCNWILMRDINEGRIAHRAIGIDICASEFRGRHAGTNALRAFIQYFASHGCAELYTQTWSGNCRMVHLAEKLGFTVCQRVADKREVRGKKYDGLTFVLDMKRD